MHAGDPMVPRLARVTASHNDAPGVQTLDLVLDDGPWEGFAPGQFSMLSVFGVGEVPISFSGDPVDASKIVHTVRAVGPVSKALARLRKNQVLGLRGPYGQGWPVDEAKGRDVLVIAGGLGLAPVRPIIYRLLAERSSFGRVSLLYGARSPSDILYEHELQRWRGHLDLDVDVTVDHAATNWRGHVGVVTELIGHAHYDPASVVAFVCGPEIMMRFCAGALLKAGVAGDRIHVSMERNMKCGIGLCGHCQWGPFFICKDGPVFRYDRVKDWFERREV
jgi:NAD(P)H-flavin reductase